MKSNEQFSRKIAEQHFDICHNKIHMFLIAGYKQQMNFIKNQSRKSFHTSGIKTNML